jgi:hypothetical protein
MTGKKIFIFFCCILVAGAFFLTGCTIKEERVLPATTPAMTPVTGGPPAGGSVNQSCIIPITVNPSVSPDFGSHFTGTELLTRPTNSSVMVSLVPKVPIQICLLYGRSPGDYSCQTPAVPANAGSALNVTIQGLLPDTQYYYRVCYKEPGSTGYMSGAEHTFHT